MSSRRFQFQNSKCSMSYLFKNVLPYFCSPVLLFWIFFDFVPTTQHSGSSKRINRCCCKGVMPESINVSSSKAQNMTCPRAAGAKSSLIICSGPLFHKTKFQNLRNICIFYCIFIFNYLLPSKTMLDSFCFLHFAPAPLSSSSLIPSHMLLPSTTFL